MDSLHANDIHADGLFDVDDVVVAAMAKGQSANLVPSGEEEFVMNPRGQRLSVRSWPATTRTAVPSRGVVIFIHGCVCLCGPLSVSLCVFLSQLHK